mgnify:CR=1 FL=1
MDWYLDLGMNPDKLMLRAHDDDELSHYSSGTSDVEYLFPWGWDELEGIANRGDFDLTQHANASGEKLDFFDQASGERYVPHVIEPAAGATRTERPACPCAWSVPMAGSRHAMPIMAPRTAEANKAAAGEAVSSWVVQST